MIIAKGNGVYRLMYRTTISTGFLGWRWLDRFVNLHPLLTLISSQIIKRLQTESTLGGQARAPLRGAGGAAPPHHRRRTGLLVGYEFFNKLLKHVVEIKLLPDRVFNMDETGFSQKSKPKKCVAVTRSKHLWSKSIDDNLYLTITKCLSANGFVLTPMFVVPGQRLNQDVMDKYTIKGSIISFSQKEFMNSRLFVEN